MGYGSMALWAFLVGLVGFAVFCKVWRAIKPVLNLEAKHVIITGGSSGIGKAIGALAAAEGAHVTIIARNQARLDEAAAFISSRRKGGAAATSRVSALSADLGDAAAAKRAIAEAERQNGPADVVVASAGITRPGVFEEIEPAEFERQMRVNYLGTVHALHAVVPGMKRRHRGTLVMLASQAGQIGVYGYSAYSPSKFALRGLAECLRMELKPHNISVCVSYPPDTDTPQLAGEAEHRPAETALISGEAKMFSAEAVAADIVRGLKCGEFRIATGFDGFMLDKATCALAPALDPLELLLEVVTYPVWRVVGAAMVFYFDWLCWGQHRRRELARGAASKAD